MRIHSVAAHGLAALAVLSIAAVFTHAGVAHAGTIIAKADITYCEVQAVDCLDENLDSCQLVFNSALAAGEAIVSETGSLCYRRNVRPGDCSSALERDWRCITNFAEAPKKATVR